ncbi:ATP-dependent DNA helicase RecG [Parahaliea mediterranea]|uniref:ATP-dependent DNA helicase RecG n=1 Tax=Parahaliea mediterranea TaxID=651086 RepID=A0A939DFS3_9GAMM|nr:ATP-dependent DNA helicase RecG [Parahaliea mediterranea]MBN7797244.1 ATP-dependent DNA helicase RecG [Parahaliea mediterranea]
MSGVLADRPLESLRGVGPKLAQKLRDYGVGQVEDLLFHLPLRYQDRTRVTPIAALQAQVEAVVEGEVRAADIVFGRRRSLVARLQDGSGTVTLRFFHFTAAQKNNLKPGARLRCFGAPRRGRGGLEIYHPEYRHCEPGESAVEERLTPIYPTTDGIGQAQWRKLCSQALALLASARPLDLLPARYNQGFDLVAALHYLHTPPPDAPLQLLQEGRHPAQLRLALEELAAHHLALLRLRRQQQSVSAPALPRRQAAHRDLLRALPFKPTAAQQRVMGEIAADLAQRTPMLRLLQGDVGSGKTLVAADAALQAISNGYQVAVMAPTEILAEQHRQNFATWLAPLGIAPAVLTGRSKGKARRETLAALAGGDTRLLIGTHALFQADVVFHRLGLVIVDEQHRFGVHQRLALTEKADAASGRPHQLVMTATPIPRTLSMVAYADLDCSVIDELPPGRQAVTTVLIDAARRDQVVARVATACAEGRQAYWVCTLVEESDVLQAQAAESTAAELAEALPALRIGLIHGRLPARDKEAVMAAFKAGELSLLVATTVIEVGVDVPNASLMVIENPERLGLAQLHQLRGRVGRGSAASHCVLLYQSPLSQQGKRRLTAMRESNDGFYIAEQDLALRGPGEVLGTRQTGDMNFRIADLTLHDDLLEQARETGELIAENPLAEEQLVRRWTGEKQRFASV